MTFWLQTAGSFVKNLKRMIRSRAAMALIFFGPFIVLLLIQGVYHDAQQVNLKVGLITRFHNDEVRAFEQRLSDEGLRVMPFPDNVSCINRLKQGFVDVCAQLDYGERRDATFYVDYSKMNLVNTVSEILAGKVEDQARDLRLVFLEEMGDRLRESGELVSGAREEFDASVRDLDADSRLLSMRSSLTSTDVSAASKSLDLMDEKVQRSYGEVSRSLEGFEADVRDVRARAAAQRDQVRVIRAYGTDCDAAIPVLNEEELYAMDPEELQSEAEQYGRCKCVEYYDGNLVQVQEDLGAVIQAADDALAQIREAKLRNAVFFNEASTTVALQRDQLSSFSGQRADALREMELFDRELSAGMAALQETLHEIDERTKALSSQFQVSSGTLSNPISVTVKPVAATRDFMVYFFPLVYFFIVMFIGLLFSSSFVFGERQSLAVHRNLLSPLRPFSHVMGLLLSLSAVLFVQALVIVTLANVVFSLGMTLVIFLKVMFLSLLAIFFFSLLGLLIGFLSRSQLVVTLIAIGSSVVLFLYSSIIRPEEFMPSLVRSLIHVNPYAISAAATSKIILFDMSLGLFAGSLILVVLETLALLGLLWWAVRRDWLRS